MTLPNPESRKEAYLAKASGMTVENLPEPASREEQYLNAIAQGGGGGGTSDFDELQNRPKYNGNTMTSSTNIPEGQSYTDFIGTDGSSAGTHGLVPAPATTDAGKFLKADGTWAEAGGGETIKTLTTDDYNWNSIEQSATEPYNSVALWLLDAGFYKRGTGVTVQYGRFSNQTIGGNEIAMVGLNGSYGVCIGVFGATATSEAGFEFATYFAVSKPLGIVTGSATVSQVVDDLYSDYTNAPLSANQGRILGERSNVLSPDAPTTETEGVLGQLYTDTTNMHTYQCTAIDDSGDEPVYTWTQRW